MGTHYTSREMIDKLIGFDTVSSNSNLALIDFVADYLAGHGVEAVRVFNDDRTKANLYATVGPMTEGGVVLSGHSLLTGAILHVLYAEPVKTLAHVATVLDKAFDIGDMLNNLHV